MTAMAVFITKREARKKRLRLESVGLPGRWIGYIPDLITDMSYNVYDSRLWEPLKDGPYVRTVRRRGPSSFQEASAAAQRLPAMLARTQRFLSGGPEVIGIGVAPDRKYGFVVTVRVTKRSSTLGIPPLIGEVVVRIERRAIARPLGQDEGRSGRIMTNLAAVGAVGLLGVGLFWWLGRETAEARRLGRGRYG